MANKAPKVTMADIVAHGNHVNFYRITGTNYEYMLDFADIKPDVKINKFNTRIIMSPLGLKKFAKLLMESVQMHEATHGKIVDAQTMLSVKINTDIKN